MNDKKENNTETKVKIVFERGDPYDPEDTYMGYAEEY